VVSFNHFIWIEDLIMLVEHTMDHSVEERMTGDVTVTLEKINQLVGDKLREQTALRWFSITTEKKANGFTSFATTEL